MMASVFRFIRQNFIEIVLGKWGAYKAPVKKPAQDKKESLIAKLTHVGYKVIVGDRERGSIYSHVEVRTQEEIEAWGFEIFPTPDELATSIIHWINAAENSDDNLLMIVNDARQIVWSDEHQIEHFAEMWPGWRGWVNAARASGVIRE